MRKLVFVAIATAFFSFGCKSTSKVADAQPEATANQVQNTAKGMKKDAKAEANKTKAEATAKLECEKKNDKRSLEVRPKEKGCELAYTKNGQEAVVASSQFSEAHCKATLEKIKGNLEKAGFTCK